MDLPWASSINDIIEFKSIVDPTDFDNQVLIQNYFKTYRGRFEKTAEVFFTSTLHVERANSIVQSKRAKHMSL